MNAEKWHHSEIRIAINDGSQGSVATCLKSGGIFKHAFCCKFTAESATEKNLKIG